MKLLHLTYKEAKQHYPDQVASILKSMSAKFRRAKKIGPEPENMDWSLEWGAGVPESRPPLSEVSARLHCRHDRRRSEIRFGDPVKGQKDGEHLPHHILVYYRASVDPSKIPHAATFKIRNPNGQVDTAIATGGYVCDGVASIHYLIVGDPWIDGMNDEDLIEIRGSRAIFEGGLKDLARQRYDATKEGDRFSFGSREMRRLKMSEIARHVEGKTFNWSLF